ncbi:hypothetical protein DXT99_08955 [Pontibacter diazotrophicus]|uniref:Uncharacterized protein n=1 Tax=Pontibacter diazotrophicus TaxID=1400979 RepID=A0A3D8LFA0_9BACT|nr:hypothetical protein DXT99_08955 [Pontibacter diazotrophicus]
MAVCPGVGALYVVLLKFKDMLRGLFKLYLFRKLMGGGGGGRGRGGCAGIGCVGLIIILVIAYFLFGSF